jgi:hypothetical protein
MAVSPASIQAALQLSWVTYLKRPRPCEGWMSNRRTCKNPAHYRFTALRKSWAKSGVYCHNHLFSRGLLGDWEEENRTRNAYYRLGILCPSVSTHGERCSGKNGHDGAHHPPHTSHAVIVDGHREWVPDPSVTW